MKNKFSIAIDGPAGAGKSTIAKNVSKELGVIYVDTGAMYRAMALYMIREGIDAEDAAGISAKCKSADISIAFIDGVQQVLLNGENVSGLIRTEEVSAMASKSSVNADVREKLVELQRKLASEKSVVMDGRDIGTVVLPDAEVKIYLTASSAVRAKRRYDELIAKGEKCDLARIEADIIERDHRDMTREISPLKQAEDAVLVDTSEMNIEEVTDKLLSIVKEKCG
ncbi:MAG: (d)CMP kinase [Lachnospiraceae bacterium]|nr:(d)CMP kinase [Lachnospiraceae bacterium]